MRHAREVAAAVRQAHAGGGGAGCYNARMAHVLAATFKDGVFKPDEKPALSESARVRLVVEPIDGDDDVAARREASWAALQQLWATSEFKSNGERLTREQLHERR